MMHVGKITITYDLSETGYATTGLTIDGDMPLITQLGLIELAKDTILRDVRDD